MNIKKCILIITTLVITLILTSTCIYTYADNQKKTNIQFASETIETLNPIYKNKNDKDVTINNKEVKLKYKNTKTNKDIYISDSKDEYIYSNDKLIGFNTNDTVKINVNNSGEVVSFSAFNQGAFEQYKDISIDMKKIESKVIDTIKDKYIDNYINSNITNTFLNIIDNKLVLQIEINIETNNEINPNILEIILYELN